MTALSKPHCCLFPGAGVGWGRESQGSWRLTVDGRDVNPAVPFSFFLHVLCVQSFSLGPMALRFLWEPLCFYYWLLSFPEISFGRKSFLLKV